MNSLKTILVIIICVVVLARFFIVFSSNAFLKIGLDSFRHKIMTEEYVNKERISMSISNNDTTLQFYPPLFFFLTSKLARLGISVSHVLYYISFLCFVASLLFLFLILLEITGSSKWSFLGTLIGSLILPLQQPAPREVVSYMIIPYLFYIIIVNIRWNYSFAIKLILLIPPVIFGFLIQPHPLVYFIIGFTISIIMYIFFSNNVKIFSDLLNSWLIVLIGFTIGFYLYRSYVSPDFYGAFAFVAGYSVSNIRIIIGEIQQKWEGWFYIIFLAQIILFYFSFKFIFTQIQKIKSYLKFTKSIIIYFFTLYSRITAIFGFTMLIIGIIILVGNILIQFEPKLEFFEQTIGETMLLSVLFSDNPSLIAFSSPRFITTILIISGAFMLLGKKIKLITRNSITLLLLGFLLPLLFVFSLSLINVQNIITMRFVLYSTFAGTIFISIYLRYLYLSQKKCDKAIGLILILLAFFSNVIYGGSLMGIDDAKAEGYQWFFKYAGLKSERDMETSISNWHLPRIPKLHDIKIIGVNIGRIEIIEKEEKNIDSPNIVKKIYTPQITILSSKFKFELPIYHEVKIPLYTSDRIYTNDEIEFYTRSRL